MADKSAESVLIVDDEAGLLRSLSAFFEDEGFHVITANSAEMALEILARQKAALGIVDIRLPGMNGDDMIIRAHDLDSTMKFLIHTGSSSYYPRPEIQDLGVRAEHVFLKPVFDMSVLGNAARQRLGE